MIFNNIFIVSSKYEWLFGIKGLKEWIRVLRLLRSLSFANSLRSEILFSLKFKYFKLSNLLNSSSNPSI